MRITIGVSARHVHLTKETYDKLFNEELTKRIDLNQTGEFASNQLVTIKTSKNEFKNVRILGPFRNYDQVEISKTDAFALGLNPPVRRSGNVLDTPGITLVGPNGEVELSNGVIIAERHIHMTDEQAKELNIIDGDAVKVTINGTKGMFKDMYQESIIAFAKVTKEAYLEMHVDTDDANAFCLSNNDMVEIEKCLK